MIRHYFRMAVRVLFKNKTFSLLNISGLALGLAVFILIMLWVQNEYSYNSFHKDSDRIAAIMTNQEMSDKEVMTFPAVPSSLVPAMKKDLPGIEFAARTSWGDTRLFSYKDINIMEYGLFVDPEFLKIFSFPLTNGNADKVLLEPHTLLLSEKMAKKYFGDEDPVGKQIQIEKNYSCRVEGVFKETPRNSSLRFDFLMPFTDYMDFAMNGKENWTSNNIKSYVKLKAGIPYADISQKLKNFTQKYTDQQPHASLFLWKANDWYLRFDFKKGAYGGGGKIVYVNLFIAIAVFILLLACINFMNLSTARATSRAKEVGVRKVSGAGIRSLIGQFLGESILIAAISGVIALVLVQLILPVVNDFLQTTITLPFNNPGQISIFAAIILTTGTLAGSYPALVLSAFKPTHVLKSFSMSGQSHGAWIRKGLVVTQFAISVLLIIGTLVVKKQVDFIRNKNIGYNKEHLVWFQNNIPMDKNEAAYQEFLKVPGVTNVSRASMTFTMPNNRGSNVKWQGKNDGEEIFFNFIAADQDIIKTMGINIKEGRGFSRDFTTDTAAFILNEEAVKRMRLKDPVGQKIELYSGKGTIVGVCKDFHFESMHTPVGPVIFECRPDWTWLYYIRLDGRNTQETLEKLGKVYSSFAPGYTLDYNFQDKEYERLYRSEVKIGTLVNWFAFFAVFISCLGLLGLTTFTIERKTREIGIRKVLGASVLHIVSMISGQFLVLVLVAVLIAFIPAWYYMNEWLSQYAYRYTINGWLFGIAGLLVLVLAAITISLQAIRAAWVKPVKSLRSE